MNEILDKRVTKKLLLPEVAYKLGRCVHITTYTFNNKKY